MTAATENLDMDQRVIELTTSDQKTQPKLEKISPFNPNIKQQHALGTTIPTSTDEQSVVWINPKEVSFETAKLFQKITAVEAFPVDIKEVVMAVVNGVLETHNHPKTGDYLVTNPTGEQYLVPGAEFEQNYQLKPGTENTYLLISPPMRAIVLAQTVAFVAPWGPPMCVQAGGALVEHSNEWYGVQPEDFKVNYRACLPEPCQAVYEAN